MVTIAFRLGVVVDRVSQNLQPRLAKADSGPGDSWAYVIPDVSPEEIQKELDTIQRDEVRQYSRSETHFLLPSQC